MFFLLQFSIWSDNHCQYNSIGPDDFLVLVLISGEIGFMAKDFGRGSLATPWYLIAIFETKDLSQVFVKSGSLNIIPYIPKTLLFHLYEPIDCLMKTRYYLKGKLLFEKKNAQCTLYLGIARWGGVNCCLHLFVHVQIDNFLFQRVSERLCSAHMTCNSAHLVPAGI